MKKDTSKIRVLETLHESAHKEVIKQLEECLADARNDTSIRHVIVCMEDSKKTVTTYWTRCEDRALLGSRLIFAGMKRMGLNMAG